MRMIQCPDCGIALSLEGHEPGEQIACEGCGGPIEVPGLAYRPPGRHPGTYDEREEQDEPTEALDGADGAGTEPVDAESSLPDGVPAVPTLGVEPPAEQDGPAAPVGLVGEAEEEPSSLLGFEIEPGRERAGGLGIAPLRPESELDIAAPTPSPEAAAPTAQLPEHDVDYALAMPRLGGGPLTGQPGRVSRRPEASPTATMPASPVGPDAGLPAPAPSFGPPPVEAAPAVSAQPQGLTEAGEGAVGTPEVTFGPPPGQAPAAAPLPPPAVADMVAPSVPTTTFGWNWGAFLLSWIWAFGNGLVWYGILGLCPCLVPQIYLGLKGSQLSWERGRWTSVEQFRASQRKWAVAGLILLLIGLVGAAVAVLGPALLFSRMGSMRGTGGPMAP